ncbi:MAG: putative hydro-lyase [Desulfuromusa sp.]
MAQLSPQKFRQLIRKGLWRKPTAGCCSGHIQLNLVILPEIYAEDFQLFCEKNPKPCPLLETVPTGQVEAKKMAPGSDLRIDIPSYKVFRGGDAELHSDVKSLWQDDFVSFLIGCSFTFENALLKNNIPIRHIELGCNVPMYITNIPCESSGPFHGEMVVSMRPIPVSKVSEVYAITGCYPAVHGDPIHHGDPRKIGITNLDKPDFGDPVPVREGEVPVFWACGVTPQVALMNLKPALAITHAPGYMFVSDYRDDDFYVG